MADCKPCNTPIDSCAKLSSVAGPTVSDPTDFHSLAGALQYLTFTRPDISYAVQQVCLHMHDPREPHLAALKKILRYIQGTLDLSLHIQRVFYLRPHHLLRCRLGRLPRHSVLHVWLRSLPWGQPRVLVLEAATHGVPL